MGLTQDIVQGTLKPDGTLELDQKPALAPGRVQVILQAAWGAPSQSGGLAAVIDDISKSQRARGYTGRSPEEIQAGLHEGEEEYEQKLQSQHQVTPEPA